MAAETNELKHILQDCRIVILGTFPSEASRKAWFYHKSTNQFWPILSLIFNRPDINHLDKSQRADKEKESKLIARRQHFLTEQHIGLWDVIKSCDIKGSSDSFIKAPVYNDLASLYMQCPHLQHIYFSSQKAFQYYQDYLRKNVADKGVLDWFDKMTEGESHILPSPSSANARKTLAQKRTDWQRIFE